MIDFIGVDIIFIEYLPIEKNDANNALKFSFQNSRVSDGRYTIFTYRINPNKRSLSCRYATMLIATVYITLNFEKKCSNRVGQHRLSKKVSLIEFVFVSIQFDQNSLNNSLFSADIIASHLLLINNRIRNAKVGLIPGGSNTAETKDRTFLSATFCSDPLQTIRLSVSKIQLNPSFKVDSVSASQFFTT